MTTNSESAVETRILDIDTNGFQIALETEQANRRKHGSESVAYIAWEPSAGELNGRLRLEVAETVPEVTDAPYPLDYLSAFDSIPVLLADMQTATSSNTANLRWRNKDRYSVELWIDEEAPRNPETNHPAEAVGYILIEDIGQ